MPIKKNGIFKKSSKSIFSKVFFGAKSRKRRRLSRLKFQEKILQIKRVTKVVKGGKILTFRAVVIIGNGKGKVGVGIGRGQEVTRAIEKAILYGKKRLINVPLTKNLSLPHVVSIDYGASKIVLRPASLGTGVIAGGSIKTVLELAGVKNVLAKQKGSSNLLNNAKATILGLKKLSQIVEVRRFQSNRNLEFYSDMMRNSIKQKKAKVLIKILRMISRIRKRRQKLFPNKNIISNRKK